MYVEESNKGTFRNVDKLSIVLVENPITKELCFLVTNNYEGGADRQGFTCKEITFDGVKFTAKE